MNRHLRTFSLCLTVLCLLFSLPTAAQKLDREVTIKATGEELAKVFKRIETATNYKVIYVTDDVKNTRVSGTFSSSDISELMKQVLDDTKLYFTIDGNYITVTKSKPSGNGRIDSYDDDANAYLLTGKVVDENGVALPGVSVFIVGTKMGTTTDVDGRFSLKVRGNDVLRFTFVGYKENVVSIKNRKTINTDMRPDAQQLKEVQVVAFGTQKKESVVGAITTVRPMDLKTSNSDFTAGFAGKIAGVIGWQTGGMPGALTEGEMNTKFYIRGIRHIPICQLCLL